MKVAVELSAPTPLAKDVRRGSRMSPFAHVAESKLAEDVREMMKMSGFQSMLERDAEFFRSVHLCGEGLQKEMDEAKLREAELFRSKVCVDSLDFKVDGFNVEASRTNRNSRFNHEAPLQLDADTLSGAGAARALSGGRAAVGWSRPRRGVVAATPRRGRRRRARGQERAGRKRRRCARRVPGDVHAPQATSPASSSRSTTY